MTSSQPTITLRPPSAVVKPALWLPRGLIVQDAIGRSDYRIVEFLGRGGFGAAYQVHRLTRSKTPEICVLKVTRDAPTWHREAYFGHLLRRLPGLVEVYGSFAWSPQSGGLPYYCLISEYFAEGDLSSYLQQHPEPWPESRATREIVRILRAVTRIHESGAVHRDITPGNVFVAPGPRLKLGDFGIALHRVGRKEVAADAFAPRYAPRAVRMGARFWRQADDVNQLGQLYGSLLRGQGPGNVISGDVKNFGCSAHVKAVLQRCMGERRKCFATAAEMLEAIEARRQPTPKSNRVHSLTGKHIVFTGGLSLLRADAGKFARKAGAIVEDRVSHQTDIVVVGDQSPQWKAEAKGQKLLDVDRETERGHTIAIVKERRFLALVGVKP